MAGPANNGQLAFSFRVHPPVVTGQRQEGFEVVDVVAFYKTGFSQRAVVNEVVNGFKYVAKSRAVTNHNLLSGSFGCIDDFLTVFNCNSERFFHKNMLARVERGDGLIYVL